MKALAYFSIAVLSILAVQTGCKNQPAKTDREAEKSAQQNIQPVQVPIENGLAKAYFASGCFWCVEAVYESVDGVKEAISGYSGGHTENPTYDSSNTGTTGHAEAVEVIYDPSVVSFSELLDVYFVTQNVTQVNGQGPDMGSQYRSIVFYQNEDQKKVIDSKIAAINKELGDKEVAAEVLPFEKFWIGEDYHQNFERRNPDHPYVQRWSIPRLERLKKYLPDLVKAGETH